MIREFFTNISLDYESPTFSREEKIVQNVELLQRYFEIVEIRQQIVSSQFHPGI